MKKLLCFFTLFALLFPLSCAKEKAKEEIIIVYTNDIHGYIDNVAKDSSGKEVDALRFSKLSGYVKELRKSKNVLLVDAGDEVQGTVYGSLDQGKQIIPIMNEVGYDLATVGNHDFDFGMDGFDFFKNTASFPYLSCNFVSLPDQNLVLPPYKIFDFNGTKIGFIGISTPETIISSTPGFFQDDQGNYLYSFLGYEDPNDLFAAVQKYIDELKPQTNYIVALGHVGVGMECKEHGYSSYDVISHTQGLSAFIDGHSHTSMEQEWVKTLEGKNCLLTQTGCYLSSFGELHIDSKGNFSSRLIADSEYVDKDVQNKENALIAQVQEKMGQTIATLEKPLYVNDPEVPSRRIIRAKETNLGNLCSDSMYWYLNQKKELNCDLALINGGGIRAGLEKGKVSYLDVKQVHPFGNQLCLVEAKGKDVLNALEMGVTLSGQWDEAQDRPAENGNFLHVAGLTYDVDTRVPSSVKVDESGMFVSVDGEYRIKNVKVYDKEHKSYVPLKEESTYRVGGINYLLQNSGGGLSMFASSSRIADYINEDYVVLAEYMKEFDSALINNWNAPLGSYEGYLYDYENPYGGGRVNFLSE